MKHHHVAEAAAVYQAGLGLDKAVRRSKQHPKNVWVLRGLYDRYLRLEETDLAAILKLGLDIVQWWVEQTITTFCYLPRKALTTILANAYLKQQAQ